MFDIKDREYYKWHRILLQLNKQFGLWMIASKHTHTQRTRTHICAPYAVIGEAKKKYFKFHCRICFTWCLFNIQLFRFMCVSTHICSSRCNSIQCNIFYWMRTSVFTDFCCTMCIDFPSPNTLRTNHRSLSPLLSIIIAVVFVWHSQTVCLLLTSN